ncbi:MAG TPA: HAD family hydrolase [Spirochaetales bacterium]|nr:HAD family hydrolase [Spirochaetales bacterium]HRY56102.1 HAD family hydrolase [Spirochaetia bacterium]HRZ63512.1 HAD family hydrolase [Spirochaetia bacterium]
MRFKAVAFDLDGTLYPDAALGRRALPLVLGHPLLFAAFARARREVRKLVRAPGGPRPRDGAEFRRLQAELTAAALGPFGRGGPEAAGGLLDEFAYRGVVELFAGLPPYPGVVPALDELAAAGLRLAVLSDLPPGRKLALMGLGGRFEAELCSEDSGLLKPEPEPFRMLGEALGLGASEILYVGNSLACDLAGAKAAGMAAAMVSRSRVAGAELSFFDWAELAAFALA